MNEHERLTKNIAAVVAAYRKAHPIAVSTVSRMFFNDGKFLEQILGARPPAFLVTKYDDGIERLSREWPNDAVWPAAVDRPPVRRARKAG